MNVCWLLTGILFLTFSIQAKPKGGNLVSGEAKIFEKAQNMEIVQASKRAILEWDTFNLSEKEKIHFVQPENGVVLNKVASGTLSEINGLLKADGHLYLMNPNGVIIGEKGVVKAKSFFVIGQNIKEDEFFNQKGIFQISVEGSIINRGTIQTNQGNVFLIGKEVKNFGSIEAEQVNLVGSSEVFLQREDEEHICVHIQGVGSTENTGLIKAAEVQIQSAGGDIYQLAVNQSGVIEAIGTIQKKGRIILSSEKGDIKITGKMKAQDLKKGGIIEVKGKDKIHILDQALLCASHEYGGGHILIGENTQKVSIDPGSKIEASAIEKGDGGQVMIWADEQNMFQGDVTARGGFFEGDGGFVEISCPKNLVFRGGVDTTANNGKIGSLLLDPSNIVIDDFGGNSTPAFPTTPPGTYNPTERAGRLDVANVQAALALTNVIVSTAGGTGGAGTVTINSGFTWSAPTTFSVTANRNIILDGVTISNTNLLGGFTAVDLQANQGPIETGNFDGIFLRNATISSATGAINLLARGGTFDNNYGVHLFESTISSLGSVLDTATITLNGTGGAGVNGISGVVVESNSSVNSLLGNISITGISNGSGGYNHGVWVFLSSEVRSSGLGLSAATITLDGTSSAGSTDNYGVNIQENSTVSSSVGNMDITAISNGTQEQNVGLQITRGGRVASVGTVASAATIMIQATSGNGGNTNQGIFMDASASIESINGDIDITAESRGRNVSRNHGVLLTNFSFIRSTGTVLNAADITIIGTPGTGEIIGTRTDLTSDVTVVDGALNITGGFERGRSL